jgi:hypothetical protein
MVAQWGLCVTLVAASGPLSAASSAIPAPTLFSARPAISKPSPHVHQEPKQCDLDDYKVYWYDAVQAHSGDAGTELTIVRLGQPAFHKFLDALSIESVTEWYAPGEENSSGSGVTGVMMRCGFPAGNGRAFIIIADLEKGRWKQVLDVASDKCGFNRGLEIVDVDGDTYPELLVVPDYRPYYTVGLSGLRTQVWKWSAGKKIYVLERTTLYRSRLQRPERLKERW